MALASMGWGQGVCWGAFTNVTSTAVRGSALNGGLIPTGKAAWADYNNDGWVDLNVDGRVLRNNRDGTLQTVSGSAGSSIWGDYNNDGFVDLFQYDGGILWLWRNNAGASFTQASTLQNAPPPSRGATWGDFNGDRRLDLYVGGYESDSGYHPDSIFTNNGNGTFSKTWTQGRDSLTTPGYPRPARGVTSADFDRDGDIDVYVSNYRLEPNALWRNNGTGSFTDVAGSHNALATSSGYYGGHSIGAVWGDFNNDGEIDLFAGNFAHNDSARPNQPQSRFLKNRGPSADFMFEDRGTGGVFYQESYASPTAGDIDNDGDLDLYFTTVYNVASFGVPNYPILYRNDGNFRFVDVTAQWGLPTSGSTYQAAFADYNNDGYLDLVSNGSLYRNTGGANHYLKVDLDWGPGRDATAIGAQVRLRLGGATLTRQVEGAVGEGNQNDHTLHFGLGSHNGPVELEVRWPDGATERVGVASVDRTVTIRQSTPVFVWGPNGSSSWTTPSNWAPVAIPGSDKATVIFGANSRTQQVTLDRPATVKYLQFTSKLPYTLRGSGSLTMRAFEGPAQIEAAQGRHTILNPVDARHPMTVDVAAGASLFLNGAVDFSGVTLTKTGYGSLEFNSLDSRGVGQLDVLQGQIAGRGRVAGNVTNYAGWTSPGPGPAKLTIGGSYTQHAASNLLIELGGTAKGRQYDSLNVLGSASLGGTLSVVLINGFTPTVGQSFDILDFSSVSGNFSSVNLPAGFAWNTSQLLTTGVLTVSPAGDFDSDGDFDGMDFAAWSAGFGLAAGANQPQGNSDGDDDVDGLDFLKWQRNFGRTGGGLGAVPEPTAMSLSLASALCLARRRHCRAFR